MGDHQKRTGRRSMDAPVYTSDASDSCVSSVSNFSRASSASGSAPDGGAKDVRKQGKKPQRASMQERLPSQSAARDEWGLGSTATTVRHSDELARKDDMEERTIVLRAHSERRGRRHSFRLEEGVPLSGLESSSVRSPSAAPRPVFDHGRSLRQRLALQIVGHDKVVVDLSHRWDTLDKDHGARTKLIHGLLVAGHDKLIRIDLSNHRIADLRGWAEVRGQRGWVEDHRRHVVADKEAPAVVKALKEETMRALREQQEMPALELTCRDQSLSAVVLPLVKRLGKVASLVSGLQVLDLNRYTRSAEVGGAVTPGDARAEKLITLFVDALARILSSNRSLKTLGLRMNGIGPRDLVTIATAAGCSTSLNKLDLSCNPLCESFGEASPMLDGMLAMKYALAANATLTELDLSFCNINEDAADLLVQALTSNKTLKRVVLSGNPIGRDHPVFTDKRVDFKRGD